MASLLISTYELGHQPLGLASPAAHINSHGLPVECLDLAVQHFDEELVRQADFVGISIPMHTAIRLGVRVAERVRRVNEDCHICFYGLYASLNGRYLLRSYADSVIGGEFEQPLVNLVLSLSGRPVDNLFGVWTLSSYSPPFLGRQQLLTPARDLLPPLERYAHLDTGTELKPVGSVAASRGCAHQCLHCPITPVYEGRMRIVQREVVLEDIGNLVGMGAQHISFNDPDFLNGVKHSMLVVQGMHER
ncbi:MAG: cobalamin-dependent protein, partial [Dehalococcoidia bacterium]